MTFAGPATIPGARRAGGRGGLAVFSTPEAGGDDRPGRALRLQGEGYYAATVEAKTTAQGRVAVALHVARGTDGQGRGRRLRGQPGPRRAALLAVLPQPGSQEFFEALDPRSSRISGEVRLAYAGIGYLRARVRRARSASTPPRGRLRVTIRVRERARGDGGLDRDARGRREPGAPRAGAAARAGEPFDIAAYVADRDALVAGSARTAGSTRRCGPRWRRGGDVAVRYLVDERPAPARGRDRESAEAAARGTA